MSLDLSAAGFCGVVLAGGPATRLGGVAKAGIEVGGRTLLDLAIEALLDADEVVVAGAEAVRTSRPVTFVREDPPYGGPVAGLLTGVDALLRRPRLVGVLAVDLPRVTPYTFRRLRQAAAGRDGAFLTRPDGGRVLAGVLDAARLADVRPDLEHQHGMALERLVGGLDLAAVEAVGERALEVGTWADLRDLSP